MKKRDRAVDILRGFGMILIIVGHCFETSWTRYIYSFHMPLYFFLSGYCVGGRKKLEKPGKYILKKCRTLLLPYAFFFWLHFAIYNIGFDGGIYIKIGVSAADTIKAFFLSGGYLNSIPLYNFPLWFLPHMFLADIIFYAVRQGLSAMKGEKERKVTSFVLTVILVAVTVPVQRLIPGRPALHINILPASLAFMLLGFLPSFFPKEKLGKWLYPAALPLIFAGYILCSLNGGGNISNILSPLYYVSAMCSIAGFFSLAKRIESPLLEYMGRNTMTFLGMHMYVYGNMVKVPRFSVFESDTAYHIAVLAAGIIVLSVINEVFKLPSRLYRLKDRAK